MKKWRKQKNKKNYFLPYNKTIESKTFDILSYEFNVIIALELYAFISNKRLVSAFISELK